MQTPLFWQNLPPQFFQTWLQTLNQKIYPKLSQHGHWQQWQQLLQQLPNIKPSQIKVADTITIGQAQDLRLQELEQLMILLQALCPWRKGPYDLFGINIDTEWRSDWKWQRVLPFIQPLKQRWVLDIGCGNGYYGWRMLEQGADLVVGIDTVLAYGVQFLVMQHYLQDSRFSFLPCRSQNISPLALFDTVFSMGVLYHQRSPFDHLLELKAYLKPKGELVLETLVIDGELGRILVPDNRYAKMRNVWFIPSVPTLEQWLKRCGYRKIRCVDINQTSIREQRCTDWMQFESLVNFLDQTNLNFTIEGYPAPKRAILIAEN